MQSRQQSRREARLRGAGTRRVQTAGFLISDGTPRASADTNGSSSNGSINSGPGKRRKTNGGIDGGDNRGNADNAGDEVSIRKTRNSSTPRVVRPSPKNGKSTTVTTPAQAETDDDMALLSKKSSSLKKKRKPAPAPVFRELPPAFRANTPDELDQLPPGNSKLIQRRTSEQSHQSQLNSPLPSSSLGQLAEASDSPSGRTRRRSQLASPLSSAVGNPHHPENMTPERKTAKLSEHQLTPPLPSSMENSPEPQPSTKRPTLPSRTPQTLRKQRLPDNTPIRTTVNDNQNKRLSPVKPASDTPMRRVSRWKKSMSNSTPVRSSPRLQSKRKVSYAEYDIVPDPQLQEEQEHDLEQAQKPAPEPELEPREPRFEPEPEPEPKALDEREPELEAETQSMGQPVEPAQQKSALRKESSKSKRPAKAKARNSKALQSEPQEQQQQPHESDPQVQEPTQEQPSRPKSDASIKLNLQKVPVSAGGTKKINAVDVISQIVLEILETSTDELDSPWQINAFTQYNQLVEQRFGKLIDSIDVNNSLQKAVKRAELKRNSLRVKLLELRQKRTQLALEMQRVREKYQSDKTHINKLREISSFVENVEGLKELSSSSHHPVPSTSSASSLESLMIDFVKLDPIINNQYGVLERIKLLTTTLAQIDQQLS